MIRTTFLGCTLKPVHVSNFSRDIAKGLGQKVVWTYHRLQRPSMLSSSPMPLPMPPPPPVPLKVLRPIAMKDPDIGISLNSL